MNTDSSTHQHSQHPERPGGDTLDVLVLAPGFLDPHPFSFRKNLTVSEAARQAAETLGYRPNTPGFQDAEGKELPGDKRLVAAGVRDGDVLELIDTAGGV